MATTVPQSESKMIQIRMMMMTLRSNRLRGEQLRGEPQPAVFTSFTIFKEFFERRIRHHAVFVNQVRFREEVPLLGCNIRHKAGRP